MCVCICVRGGGGAGRGKECPGALSFKLGPGSYYLPNQHSHNVKQQTNSGPLRKLYARKEREVGAEERGREEHRDRWREVGRKYVRKNIAVVKIFFPPLV